MQQGRVFVRSTLPCRKVSQIQSLASNSVGGDSSDPRLALLRRMAPVEKHTKDKPLTGKKEERCGCPHVFVLVMLLQEEDAKKDQVCMKLQVSSGGEWKEAVRGCGTILQIKPFCGKERERRKAGYWESKL